MNRVILLSVYDVYTTVYFIDILKITFYYVCEEIWTDSTTFKIA